MLERALLCKHIRGVFRHPNTREQMGDENQETIKGKVMLVMSKLRENGARRHDLMTGSRRSISSRVETFERSIEVECI